MRKGIRSKTRSPTLRLSGAAPALNRKRSVPLACRLRPRGTTRQAAPAVATLPRAPRELRRFLDQAFSVVRRPPRPGTASLSRRLSEGENPGPVFPSGRASSFRCPCRPTSGPAILSFKRGHSLLSPKAVTKVAETTFAPAPPDALRANTGAFTIAEKKTAAGPGSGRNAGNRPLRPQTWKTTRYVRPGRAITRRRGC